MKNNLLIFILLLIVLFSLTSCEELLDALIDELAVRIREPDRNEIFTSNTVTVEVSTGSEIEELRINCSGQIEWITNMSSTSRTFYNALDEGSNTVRVTGYDIDGIEVDEDSRTVYLDTTEPSIILNFNEGDTFNTLPITLTGNVSDSSGIRQFSYIGDFGLYDDNILFDAGGDWSITLSDLKDETDYKLKFAAKDGAGWTRTVIITITYDTS